MRRLFLMIVLLWSLVCVSLAEAKSITLAWDANSESNLAGYMIYYGLGSSTYGTPIDVGNVTTYELQNIDDGIYYIALTAYDTLNDESEKSDEIVVTVDGSSTTTTIIDIVPPAVPANLRRRE